MAQIMSSLMQNSIKLKKVGKTTRPFRYDLNQIPCDYTAEMKNRFKGIDPVDKVPEDLGWRFVTLYRTWYGAPHLAQW